jgi:2-polyprenyl-3-methyl-5-hydroxy-6-metoxy-1,4-benzoquinol methylase
MPLTGTYASEALHQSWWSVYFDPEQDAFNARLYRRLFDRLALPCDAMLLDAGCGRGVHAVSCCAHVGRCVAVDLADDVLTSTTARVVETAPGRIALCCTALEDLPFADASFDVVHCRGVLMHIPDWRAAVRELCRVVKPGGTVLIFETNHRSLEARLVRRLRQFGARKSRMLDTEGGTEFWADLNGTEFVVRATNLDALTAELSRYGVAARTRLATEFWDLNRIPAGLPRRLAFLWNRLWFRLALSPALSGANALIARKQPA